MGRSTLLSVLPLAVGVLVSAAIWLPPSGGRSALTQVPAAAAAMPRPDLAGLAPVAASRPLFVSSRRPLAQPAGPEAVAAAPAAPAQPRLAGVVTSGANPVALIRLGSAQVQRLGLGDRLAEWQIVAIGRANATIQNTDGERLTITVGK